MKQKYFLIIILFLSFLFSYSQTSGDFRSKSPANSNWTTIASWETYNGSTWANATAYPGQIAGSYTVTIQTGDTITIATNLSTTAMGQVIVFGTLRLNPPSSPNTINFTTPKLVIDGGTITFVGSQLNLNLPTNAVLEIKNSGKIDGSCTHNDKIYIGNQQYAACRGTGNNDYVTFGEIVASGGTINAEITNPSSVLLVTSCINQSTSMEGRYDGAAGGIVSYEWIITHPDGTLQTLSTGTLANNAALVSTSFTPTIMGDYIISFKVSTVIGATNFSNTETRSLLVQSVPTAGNIGSTQTICYSGDPAIFTNTTSGTGDGTITYKWETAISPFTSWITIGGANSATYDAPAGLIITTQYRRKTISTINSIACESAATAVIQVTVLPNFTPGTIPSTGETICFNGDPALIGSTTPSSGGDNIITYKWQANGTDIPSSNTATYDPPTGLMANTTYTRLAKDGTCNAFTVSSGSWMVIVRPNFTTGTIPSTGETICYNGDPALIGSTTAASGGDNSISYKWQANGTDISGANAATYDPPVGLIANTTYTRFAKDGTCNAFTVSSGSWVVTVHPNFTPGTIPSVGETICYNGDPGIIGSTTAASGGDNTLTYQWQANGTDILSANAVTYDPPTGLIANTTYTRFAKDGTCNAFTVSSGSWVVTVRPNFTPGTISSIGETICYNGNPALIGSTTPASGGDNSISYKWQANGTDISGANAATYDPPAGLIANTTYTRFAKDGTCNAFTVSSGSWMVIVRPNFNPGTIPSTGETICYNGDPALIGSTTAASGGDNSISYKWQANGTDIPSSNTATYDPPAGLIANTTYTRWAKDGTCNSFTTSSGSWMVIVRPNFNPGTIPSTGETICYNGDPGIIGSTTAASGGDNAITYQWKANGTDISGANAATFDPPAGLTADTTYSRWAKDGTCNLFTVASGSWLVTVRPNFTSGTIPSTGETICYNGNPGIIGNTLAASGGNNIITYKWQANGTDISGANAATYDPPTGLTTTTTYTRWAKDGTCNAFTVSSGSWVVTVQPNFTPGTIPSTGETICYNGDPGIIGSTTTASGGDNAITYQWKANGTDISGANAATFDPPAGLTADTTYSRWAKDGTCNLFTVASGSWLVTVRPNFTSGTIPSTGETICYNGNPGIIGNTLAASGGNNIITYKWQANGTDISGASAATYDPPTGLTTTTTYTRWAKDGICNAFTASSSSWVVTVRPNFTPGTIPSTGETICYNGDPALIGNTTAASGGDNSITYKWQINGVDIAISNSATYDPPAGLTATKTYTRLAKDGTCNAFTASSGSWVVTVLPNFTPGTIPSTGETICYNGDPGIIGSTAAASGGDNAVTYQWKENGTDISGANAATYDPPAGLTANTTYTRWAKDGTCNAFTIASGSWVVTVRPNFTSGTIASTGETICYNGNPGLIASTLAASGGNNIITYKWQANGTDISGANAATYDPPTGLTTTTTYTRWAKDGTCNAFTASSGSWVVTVRPNFTPGTIPSTGETICYNGDPGIIGNTTAASGGDNIITYKWQANGTDIPSSNTATYDPPTGLMTNTTYTRWAKDGTCNPFTVASGSWVVTVRPNFNPGTISSIGATICYNGNPALIGSTTAASGGDNTITYQWKANGTDISGANAATYDPPAGLTTTTTYTRWAKDGTCNAFTSSTGSYTVIVRPDFTPGTIPSTGETICYNGNPALIGGTIPASGGDNIITYKWQINGVDIPSSNSATYDPPAGLTATKTYTRLAKDGTCNAFTVSSGNWVVTVHPNFTPGTIPSTGETICYNGDPGIIGSTTTASGGDNAVTYQWKENGTDISGANAATYDPPAGLTANTTYTRWAKDGTCNAFTVASGSWTVTVRPNFNPGTIPSTGESICYSGNPVLINSTLSASGGNNVITYQWQANGVNIPGATATTYDPPANLTTTTTYTRWAKDGICNILTVATGSWTVTIFDNTPPSLTPGLNQSANTATGLCTASVSVTNAIYSDNCTVSSFTHSLSGATTKTTTSGQVETYVFNKGVTTITYTVTDNIGNITAGTKTITVNDIQKPNTPTLPTINAQCSITVPAPTTLDNCDGTVTATTSDNTVFTNQGTFSIVWSFKDSSNNETIATQSVVINDTTAPVPDITNLPNNNVSGCQIDSLTPPTATDNCSGVLNGIPNISFPFTKQGPTVITWTYTDAKGIIKTQDQNLTLTSPPIAGGTLKGYLSDTYTVADATDNIAITSCPDDTNPIKIDLTGEIGTIIRWEKFEAGNTNWQIIPNTTNTYNIIFNYLNTKSTLFRVLVQVGSCTQYSNMVNVHAIPPDVPPILEQNDFTICLNDSVTLIAHNGYNSASNVDDGGDFNNGQFPNKWDPTQWKIDGQTAGAQWTASGNNTKFNNWSGTNNHPVGTNYRIEYDSNDFKFGIAHGNYNSAGYKAAFPPGNPTRLETPIFSLVGLKTASVDFDQAFNLHAGDIAKLELSLDGGATYTVTLQNLIGTSPRALSWGDTHGAPVPYPYVAPGNNGKPVTKFNFQNDNSSFDISDYIGNNNVRVRWTFFGTTDESAWAIDNISIPVRPYSDQLEWTDGIGEPGEPPLAAGTIDVAYTFVPSSPGVHQYGATSLINGCRAYDPDGTAIADVKVNYSYAGANITPILGKCGGNSATLNAYDNRLTAVQNKSKGSYPGTLNNFSDDPGTQTGGTWSIVNGPGNTCGIGSFSPNANDPNATFSGAAGTYTLKWKVATCEALVQVTLQNCDVIDFDGQDDFVNFRNNYNLSSSFTVEVWVKPESQSDSPTNIKSILTKRNGDNLSSPNGYDLRLDNSNVISFNWNNGGSITSPFPISTSRWYHIAVTFDGTTYKLYIDGIEVKSTTGSAPLTNNNNCLLGAMDRNGNPNQPMNYYRGWMDEIRIWNTSLNKDQLHQMMNQEVNANGAAVRGTIIPIDVYGLTWANLSGYYRMNDISCGYLKPFAGKGVDGKLFNINTSQQETAPLPYTTVRNGNWKNRTAGTTPWLYGSTVWDFPNSTGVNGDPIDWNIVVNSNNLNNDDKDITLLGFIMNTGTQLDVHAPGTLNETNLGHMLWITHYLKLNGFINLVGESQLLQKRYYSFPTQNSESIFEETSTGYIKRDQQGKKNSFNYNYWTSPVSIRGAANNSPYTLNGVLRDGTDSSNPKIINFVSTAFAADGPVESPIKISTRWIWSYNSNTLATNSEWDNYYLWNHIYNYGSLNAGEGFTMKGTGGTAPLTDQQNYAFTGKPNSGTITLGLPLQQTYLVGNPYPSALDADEFIKDNTKDCADCRSTVNTFNGALYYWDHLGITDNHNLAEYEGGYATYTLIGGTIATVNGDLNSQTGNEGNKKPGRYIPVAQGFFVDAALETTIIGSTVSVQGGPLVFKNSQRAFIREGNSNSVFMKPSVSGKIKNTIEANSDLRPKIRLGYFSTTGKHRQLLVGSDKNTTLQFDLGYDAPMFDLYDDDLYWTINNSPFVIQGIPNFDNDQIIPLGLLITKAGLSTIKIDELENIPNDLNIYIYDAETNQYHDIRMADFSITLPTGKYTNRFSLRFEKENILSTDENILKEGIKVYFEQESYSINITNYLIDTLVTKITLFNSLGQNIKTWKIDEVHQENIHLQSKKVSSGVYIVNTKTNKGSFNTTIIIK